MNGYVQTVALSGLFFDMTMSPDQTGVYILGASGKSIAKLTLGSDGTTYTVHSIPWNGGTPRGLAFSPDSSTLYIISVVADFSGVTYLVTAIDPVTGILKEIAGAPNPLVLLTVPQGGQAMINMAADGSTLFAFLFCTTTDPNTGCVSSTVDKIDVTTGQFVPFTIPDHFGFGLTPDGRGAVRRRNQPIAIWPRGQPH